MKKILTLAAILGLGIGLSTLGYADNMAAPAAGQGQASAPAAQPTHKSHHHKMRHHHAKHHAVKHHAVKHHAKKHMAKHHAKHHAKKHMDAPAAQGAPAGK